jgi:hypothetical protein
MSLGGVAQRGLDDGRGLMGSRRVKEPSDANGGVDGRHGESFRFGLTLWRWLADRGGSDL